MKHIPIRLGPLALLLAVISICMTTLGILAFTTARADWRLAQEYADTVQVRYGLEEEAQRFLQTAQEALDGGAALDGLPDTETDEDGVTWRILESGEYQLKVGMVPDQASGLRVVDWRIEKEWEPDEGMELWLGE